MVSTIIWHPYLDFWDINVPSIVNLKTIISLKYKIYMSSNYSATAISRVMTEPESFVKSCSAHRQKYCGPPNTLLSISKPG